MTHRQLSIDQKGFTILELLIATAILSVILLLATAMIIGIGNLYYKGVALAQTQDDTRTIVDDITQHIQLTGGSVTASAAPLTVGSYHINAYCIGNTRYSYLLGTKIGTVSGGNTLYHVLWRDNPGSGNCAPANLTLASPTAGPADPGTEMIGTNSRLSNLTITISQQLDLIGVAVAYGDDNLLSNPASTTALCKGGIGEQFCATSSLSTSVTQRL